MKLPSVNRHGVGRACTAALLGILLGEPAAAAPTEGAQQDEVQAWTTRRTQFWGAVYRSALAEASEVRVYKTIEGVDLHVYIFRPAAPHDAPKTPAIMLFHGGSWGAGDPDICAPHCRYLASRGMVAMTVEYRFHSKRYTPPQALMNAKTAIRWARRHAGELRIDPTRIAVGGYSAGGHLAAAAAALDGFNEPGEDQSVSARPDALVLISAVIDCTDTGWVGGAKIIRALGMEPETFSPLQHITAGFPPTFFQYGESDPGVAPVAPRLTALMQRHGDRCQTLAHPQCWHGSYLFNGNSGTCFTDTMRHQDAFLVSLGFLPAGEPALSLDRGVSFQDAPPARKPLADLSGFSPVGQWRIANGWHVFRFDRDGGVATPDGKTGRWRVAEQRLLYTWPDGTEVGLPVVSPTEIEFPMSAPPSRNDILILKRVLIATTEQQTG